MAVSLTFLARIRNAWDQAQGAIVSQFEELQAQLSPTLTRADATAVTVAALGVAVVPTFVASDFVGGGTQTWTVTSANVLHWSYCPLGGPRVLLDFEIVNTSVGGVADVTIMIRLPNGYVAARRAFNLCRIRDNGVERTGFAFVLPGEHVVRINRLDGAAFTASATNTELHGQLVIAVVT